MAKMFEEQRAKAAVMNGPPTSKQGLRNHEKWLVSRAGGEKEARKMIEEGYKILNKDKPQSAINN